MARAIDTVIGGTVEEFPWTVTTTLAPFTIVSIVATIMVATPRTTLRTP